MLTPLLKTVRTALTPLLEECYRTALTPTRRAVRTVPQSRDAARGSALDGKYVFSVFGVGLECSVF